MKLWILSDLHLEVAALEEPLVPPEGADVCVMAGDLVNSASRGVKWLADNVDLPSVYVPGNHEFYRNSVIEGLEAGREEARLHPQVHFLENDLAVIGGVRFIGAALWTDFCLMGQQPLAMEFARGSMNDYRAISWRKEPWQRFLPRHSHDMHVKSRRFLETALKIPFAGPTVVVTHHCPHPLSVHEKYRGDLLNAAFTSDLTDVIELGRPDLWVHGHTHDSFDYEVGQTRVICNPRGYARENVCFDRGLVVDTDVLPRYAGQETYNG